jgi:alkylhydroperoxidase/carboxymuconolactone decarboxylase family protein YurZ
MARKPKSRTPVTDLQRRSGDWNPLWSTLHDWDPEFLEAYLTLRNVPFRNGPLHPKIKELILVAINAATTHLYAPGVRRHIHNALQHGATRAEILEVIQLTTVLGIHSSNIAVPILAEELADRESTAPAQPSRRRKAAGA